MQLYERVERLASQSRGKSFSRNRFCRLTLLIRCILDVLNSSEAQEELRALEAILPIFHKMLPSLLDSKGLEQYEVLSLVNPHLVNAHTTYHGSVLMLYTTLASVNQDARSRALQFEAARSLADLYAQLRGAEGMKKVRSFILPMVSVYTTTLLFV